MFAVSVNVNVTNNQVFTLGIFSLQRSFSKRQNWVVLLKTLTQISVSTPTRVTAESTSGAKVNAKKANVQCKRTLKGSGFIFSGDAASFFRCQETSKLNLYLGSSR